MLFRSGTYVAPHMFELKSVSDLKREVFGPVLHIVRWKSGGLGDLLDQIDALGYGLTLGVHTRIDAVRDEVVGTAGPTTGARARPEPTDAGSGLQARSSAAALVGSRNWLVRTS